MNPTPTTPVDPNMPAPTPTPTPAPADDVNDIKMPGDLGDQPAPVSDTPPAGGPAATDTPAV